MLLPQIPKFFFEAKERGEISKESFLKVLNEQFSFYEFFFAKNGAFTASENSLAIHSAYNPQREAEQTAEKNKDSQKEIFIFAGIGLGYLPQAFAKKFPQSTFVILEPDAPHFFAALVCLDFSEIFKIEKLFFIIGASAEQAAALVENAGGFENAQVFLTIAQALHAKKYFETFFSIENQNAQKSQANTNTLERFGMRWLKNSARNLQEMQRLCGANIFFGEAKSTEKNSSMPAVILAAGPTLQNILPHLAQIKERAILILESAVYPSAFRFDCRKKILISALFPLGKFIESNLGKKGELSSGDSVATTAWEFARTIGSEKIFFAGLDLGFPQKKNTHQRKHVRRSRAHFFHANFLRRERTLQNFVFREK